MRKMRKESEEKQKKESRSFPSGFEPLESTRDELFTIKNLIEEVQTNEDVRVRKKAIGALGKVVGRGNKEEAIKAVVKALENEDADVKEMAALALGEAARNGQDISEAIPKLIEVFLGDKDEDVRWKAVWTLKEAAARGNKEVIKELTKVLGNENVDVRLGAVVVLRCAAENGQDISEAIEPLKKIAKEEPWGHIRNIAREALRAAGVLV